MVVACGASYLLSAVPVWFSLQCTQLEIVAAAITRSAADAAVSIDIALVSYLAKAMR